MSGTPIVAQWTDTVGGLHSDPLLVHGDPHADPDTPVVILLHGTNGTIDDMNDPSAHGVWGFDVGMRYADPVPRGDHSFPGIGVWGLGLDDVLPAPTGWQPDLDAAGFLTVNYGQVEPGGRLMTVGATPGNPILQLQGVVEAVIAAFPGRRIAFVTHSRGGILLRAWLVGYGHRPEIHARLSNAVMVHSPNSGTRVADIVLRVGGFVQLLESVLGPIELIAWLKAQTSLPAYEDYRVGSSLLTWLASNEPVPGLTIDTFGGTSTRLTRVHQWDFTLASAIPDIRLGGGGVSVTFHWSTSDHPLLGLRALADDLGGAGVREITAGQGDVLVADQSATLPYSRHHAHPVHHAQALWDPGVIADGAGVLQGARGAPSDPSIDDGWVELAQVPTAVSPSAGFSIVARIGNAGTSTWGAGTTITIDDGAGLPAWGVSTVAVPGPVSRGARLSIPVATTAPATMGTYVLRTQLQGPSGPIGQSAETTITIA